MENPFQPIEPLSEEERAAKPTKRQRLRSIPYRMIAPNLVTLLALAAGMSAMRMALEDRFEMAVYLLAGAAVLDAMDGRIARLLNATSRFGAELDSLADFFNFGVVPALVLYLWGMSDVKHYGWLSVLIFTICAALRLARFNAQIDSKEKPAWESRFFEGIPAPAGALCALLPLFLGFLGVKPNLISAVTPLYLVAVALLMVSRVPTYSGKTFGRSIRSDLVLPILVGIVLLIAIITTYPWETMSIGVIAYLATLPFSFKARKKLVKRYRE